MRTYSLSSNSLCLSLDPNPSSLYSPLVLTLYLRHTQLFGITLFLFFCNFKHATTQIKYKNIINLCLSSIPSPRSLILTWPRPPWEVRQLPLTLLSSYLTLIPLFVTIFCFLLTFPPPLETMLSCPRWLEHGRYPVYVNKKQDLNLKKWARILYW